MPIRPSSIGIIVLAAGSSSRLGQPKQLLKIDEESIIRRSARHALQAAQGPVVVVLGASFQKIEPELSPFPLSIVYNKNWEKGIGSSIKTAVKKCMDLQPELDGVIITLCDQVFAGQLQFRKLIKQFEETRHPIIASAYKKTHGVPALFSAAMFEALRSIPDDRGAKMLISTHRKHVLPIPLPRGEYDIDTPADWQKINEILGDSEGTVF